MKYIVSGVVNNRREEKQVDAASDKQAWFFFCKTYGYKVRDFKALPIPERKTQEQLSFF